MSPVEQHTRAWLATLGHSLHTTEIHCAATSAVLFALATWCLFPALDGGVSASRIAVGLGALVGSAFMVHMQQTAEARAKARLRKARKARFAKEAV